MALSNYTKEEFYRLSGASDTFKSTLVYAWFEWRKQQGKQDKDGYPSGDYNVIYDYKTQEIVATSEFGEDRFPAEDVYRKCDTKIEMQWYHDYYDGPLSGVAIYNGDPVWYQIHDWSWDNLCNVWTYKLYKLSSAEYDNLLFWHNRFENEVKCSDDKQVIDQYYADVKKNEDIDYTKNEYIGEFDECLFDRKWV